MRKWIIPDAATLLLVVRDPVAAGILCIAYFQGVCAPNRYVIVIWTIGVVGSFTAILFGHNNILIAAYGARILLLHFPLIFVIERVFSKRDVTQMGKAMVLITIPMAILIALQFYSPQTALVNIGVGGEGSGGFSGAMGFYRPPATFSFTNGTTLFFSLSGCFITYFWLEPARRTGKEKLILYVATAALILAIPLSISRSLIFHTAITIGFASMVLIRRPRIIGKFVTAAIAVIIGGLVLSLTPAFSKALEVMTRRFETATEIEGGMEGVILDRFFGGLIEAIVSAPEQPFFGFGLGLGTNVGSMFATGTKSFQIAEGEWGRTVGELGPFLGLTIVAIRIGLSWRLLTESYASLGRANILPWMLLSVGLLWTAQGGWAQPTSLGFSVLVPGLILASLKVPKSRAAMRRIWLAKQEAAKARAERLADRSPAGLQHERFEREWK